MSNFSSPLPVGCRYTSGFGSRWGTLHAGTDYGPPRPGATGTPVYALHDATIIATGYGYGRAGDRIPYHSGRFIWMDIGTHGGDRMRIYYGHLASISVKAGQKVKAGQIIGYMGGSGSSGENHFAIHLHIGVAQNHNRPVAAAGARGAPGWINPVPWLRSKGITVGSTAPVKPGSTSKPASGGSSSKKPAGKNLRTDAWLKQRLPKITSGTSKNSVGHLVGLYQRQQRSPYKLVHDQHWGTVTDQHFRWVGQLQKHMNQWVGNKLRIDGDYRGLTHARVLDLQERNHGGAYKGKLDGVAGPVFCRMLGIRNYPN